MHNCIPALVQSHSYSVTKLLISLYAVDVTEALGNSVQKMLESHLQCIHGMGMPKLYTARKNARLDGDSFFITG